LAQDILFKPFEHDFDQRVFVLVTFPGQQL